MSDISLHGLAAYLVVFWLVVILLLSVLVLAILGWRRARREKISWIRTPYFPHLLGLIVSLLGVGVVILFLEKGHLLFQDPGGYSHSYLTVPKWMDHYVLLWAPGVVALWPLTYLVWKYRRGR